MSPCFNSQQQDDTIQFSINDDMKVQTINTQTIDTAVGTTYTVGNEGADCLQNIQGMVPEEPSIMHDKGTQILSYYY